MLYTRPGVARAMPRRRKRSEEPEARPRPPSIDLVLAGRAWFGARLQPVEVGIGEDGQILAIGKALNGGERRDFGDAVLIPSAIDCHAHFRDPGGPGSVESFETGTRQAALGGVGAVVDMPNTQPPVTSVDRLTDKAGRAHGRLAVDLLLYAALTQPGRVAALSRHAAGFKLYLSPTTEIDPPPADAMPSLLAAAAATRLPVAVHAEDPRWFREVTGLEATEGWNARRPPDAEMEAVKRLHPLPDGLRLHVAHVTLPALASRLQKEGESFEVTPQHLFFSAGRGADARWKVNPPLRSPPASTELWEMFRRGLVPIVASDHAPHSAELKAKPFLEAPSGMPGIETMLPLLLARVRDAELDLPVLLRACADRPARLLGLPQGRLAVGHRANLLVVDFRQRTEIRARSLHAPCGWTAFEGWPAIFPREHYLDGRLLVKDGEYVGDHAGKLLRPEFAPGVASALA
ncbi:MAG: dihydroorotase family protein [Thermoplasmata archaeon]|nr:dihydroorotase family protein [Thermoplasmata archaeon]